MATFFTRRPEPRRLLLTMLLCYPIVGGYGQSCLPPATNAPRILVVGGGGALGAWGGGFVQHLVRDENGGHPYDVVFGTSTGSLDGSLHCAQRLGNVKKRLHKALKIVITTARHCNFAKINIP